jgi:hypothetical protein
MALKLDFDSERKVHVLVDGVLYAGHPLSRSEERKLAKDHMEHKRIAGEMREVLSPEYFVARAKAMIKGILSGLIGEDGAPATRSDALIEKMCEFNHEHIDRVLAEISAAAAEVVEGEGKNFDAGASGKPAAPAPTAKR